MLTSSMSYLATGVPLVVIFLIVSFKAGSQIRQVQNLSIQGSKEVELTQTAVTRIVFFSLWGFFYFISGVLSAVDNLFRDQKHPADRYSSLNPV